jgi:hypothetical protein
VPRRALLFAYAFREHSGVRRVLRLAASVRKSGMAARDVGKSKSPSGRKGSGGGWTTDKARSGFPTNRTHDAIALGRCRIGDASLQWRRPRPYPDARSRSAGRHAADRGAGREHRTAGSHSRHGRHGRHVHLLPNSADPKMWCRCVDSTYRVPIVRFVEEITWRRSARTKWIPMSLPFRETLAMLVLCLCRSIQFCRHSGIARRAGPGIHNMSLRSWIPARRFAAPTNDG